VPDAATTPVAHLFALKAVAPFSSLPPDDLALLVERAQPRSLATDDLLVAPGMPLQAIHLVLSGALEEHRDGQRWAVREPYELVGGVDALANAGERLVVRATQPTETLELGREDLLEVCRDRFDVLATVTAGVAAMAISARRRLGPSAGFPDVAAATTPPFRNQPDVAEIVARLQTIAPLGGTPIHTLAYAANEGTLIALQPGEPLWEAGDPSDHVVLLLSGRIDCTAEDGRQRFALGPDDVAGLLDGLALAPRWYGATAATALVGLRIGVGALLDVLEDDPETAIGGLVRFARATVGLVDEVARRRPSGV
jgi:CRP-like cAMP-binding protein